MAKGAFVRKYGSLAERLRASADERLKTHQTPCFEWRLVLRGRTGNYPRVNVRHSGQHRQFAAHRLAKVLSECGSDEHLAPLLYDFYNVAGFELDHECENPRCIRPSHLVWRDRGEHLGLTIQRRRERQSLSHPRE